MSAASTRWLRAAAALAAAVVVLAGAPGARSQAATPRGQRPSAGRNAREAKSELERKTVSIDLGPFVAGIQNTRLTTHGAAFNYSRAVSSTFVNELRVGYAKTVPFTEAMESRVKT